MAHSPQHISGAGVLDRPRYHSPSPPITSITPPPSSSQQPVYPPARTPTPTHSHLSSPPPTVKHAARQRRITDASVAVSSDSDENASTEKVRARMQHAEEEARSARATAAHYRLQYELLHMDSLEAMKRMQVELEMTRREVDVLQSSPGRPPLFDSVGERINTELRKECIALQEENEQLRVRLDDAKTLVLEREEVYSEESERLRRRIRENRHHMNQYRETTALFGELLPRIAPYESQFSSPTKSRGDESIDALLLAGQVLSQATAPSTPIGRRRDTAEYNAQQALASLPTTPFRSAPTTYAPFYRQHPAPSTPHRRRQSRDSTISASDMDDAANNRYDDSEADTEREDHFPTSQASQEAANMLRNSSSSIRQKVSHARSQSQPHPQMSSKSKQYSSHVRGPSASVLSSKTPTSPTAAGGQYYGYQVVTGGKGEAIKRRFYDDGPGAEYSPVSAVEGRPVKKRATAQSPAKSRKGAEMEGVGLGLELGNAGWERR